MIKIQEKDGAIRVPVRAVPRSRRPGVQGEHAGELKVGLASSPVDGKANRELCTVLARLLGVPRTNVNLVGGARSRSKLVEITGVDAVTARARLAP